MIRILPSTLQDRVAAHLEHLTTYSDVHDKVVSLVQASSRYGASDAMDCSGLGREEYYGEDGGEVDIDAITNESLCTVRWLRSLCPGLCHADGQRQRRRKV